MPKKSVDEIMENLTGEDVVNSPSHYQVEGLEIETIDIVRAISNQYNGFSANCIGNVLKYLIRAKKKSGVTDLKKAQKYLSWLIGEEER
jgi:Protein of unknwon function (DUF3310).